jgi:hypothetical protein
MDVAASSTSWSSSALLMLRLCCINGKLSDEWNKNTLYGAGRFIIVFIKRRQ